MGAGVPLRRALRLREPGVRGGGSGSAGAVPQSRGPAGPRLWAVRTRCRFCKLPFPARGVSPTVLPPRRGVSLPPPGVAIRMPGKDAAPMSTPTDTPAPLRVLCVDDEAGIRFVYENEVPLMAEGDVTVCENGGDAIAALNAAVKEGQPYDAALIDLRMPGGPDGWAVAEHLNRGLPDDPVRDLHRPRRHARGEEGDRAGGPRVPRKAVADGRVAGGIPAGPPQEGGSRVGPRRTARSRCGWKSTTATLSAPPRRCSG